MLDGSVQAGKAYVCDVEDDKFVFRPAEETPAKKPYEPPPPPPAYPFTKTRSSGFTCG